MDLPAEIKHRKSVAQPAFSALRRRVLFNPFLSVVEKVRLVCQGPITSLMHSSGTWVISNERERKALHGAYMSMVRPCVQPLFGLTSRKLTDEEVCCLLGVLPPQLAVCISRLRHACSIAPWVDLYTACMLFEESR